MKQTSSIHARCPACQLQLCKSREQQPHASLTEIRSNDGLQEDGEERYFTCETCSATLINSENRTKPGWRQHRQM